MKNAILALAILLTTVLLMTQPAWARTTNVGSDPNLDRDTKTGLVEAATTEAGAGCVGCTANATRGRMGDDTAAKAGTSNQGATGSGDADSSDGTR